MFRNDIFEMRFAKNGDSSVTNGRVTPFSGVSINGHVCFEYRKSSNRTTRLELFQRNNAIPPSAAAHGATAHALRMHRVDALRTLMPFFSCRVRRRSLSTVSSVLVSTKRVLGWMAAISLFL